MQLKASKDIYLLRLEFVGMDLWDQLWIINKSKWKIKIKKHLLSMFWKEPFYIAFFLSVISLPFESSKKCTCTWGGKHKQKRKRRLILRALVHVRFPGRENLIPKSKFICFIKYKTQTKKRKPKTFPQGTWMLNKRIYWSVLFDSISLKRKDWLPVKSKEAPSIMLTTMKTCDHVTCRNAPRDASQGLVSGVWC